MPAKDDGRDTTLYGRSIKEVYRRGYNLCTMMEFTDENITV